MKKNNAPWKPVSSLIFWMHVVLRRLQRQGDCQFVWPQGGYLWRLYVIKCVVKCKAGMRPGLLDHAVSFNGNGTDQADLGPALGIYWMHIMETIPRICIHLWFYAIVVPAMARSFEGHRNQSVSDFPKLILDFFFFTLSKHRSPLIKQDKHIKKPENIRSYWKFLMVIFIKMSYDSYQKGKSDSWLSHVLFSNLLAEKMFFIYKKVWPKKKKKTEIWSTSQWAQKQGIQFVFDVLQ